MSIPPLRAKHAVAVSLFALLALPSVALGALGDRTLRKGSRGADVKVLQRTLTKLSISTMADGIFGRGTVVSVKRWERTAKRRIDGVVSRSDGKALVAAAATLRPAQTQSTTEQSSALNTPNAAGGSTGGTDPTGSRITPSADGYVFPIRGRHTYGTSVNRYGADRGDHTHQGQDVLSSCGLPLVAVHSGRVSSTGDSGAGGNYLVINAGEGHDFVYMHLRDLPLVRQGSTVTAGQLVGYVGDTGDATTCHLHFEEWVGRWWAGGHTIDPLPALKAWDAAS
jgi:murein DD-endopeptidase MepM/ murein hydrolase activator NlpD